MEGELTVAGDFNAKALEWGERQPDSRGGRVLDVASRLGLVVLNTGSTSLRPAITSTSRLAFVMERLPGLLHKAPPPPTHTRWDVKKMDTERLSLALERGQQTLAETEDGPRRKELTAGAAQGSILGPDIWNASYDGILCMEMPDGCFLIGYADDVSGQLTRYQALRASQGRWMADTREDGQRSLLASCPRGSIVSMVTRNKC